MGLAAAFLAGIFARDAFATAAFFGAAFAGTFFAAFTGFLALPAFAAGFGTLRDAADARAAGLTRAGALAAFFAVPGFFLLFAIPLPIL
jgi:hypothetical protein